MKGVRRILVAQFEAKQQIEYIKFIRMDIAALLRDERDFSILLNGRLYFSEPLFPVLELSKACQNNIAILHQYSSLFH
jgi:hypothetical protein